MKCWKIVIEGSKQYKEFEEAVEMFTKMKEDIEGAGFNLVEGRTGVHLELLEYEDRKTESGIEYGIAQSIDVDFFTKLGEDAARSAKKGDIKEKKEM